MKDSNLILVERIEKAIFFIRGEKVMLDSDLASLYGVETKAVNRAAKRNLKRFPSDFMFQLTAEESAALRYQSGTSKEGRGGRRYPGLCLHRARCRDAFKCAQQRPSSIGER